MTHPESSEVTSKLVSAPRHHAMEIKLHTFLTPALNDGKHSDSHSGPLLTGYKAVSKPKPVIPTGNQIPVVQPTTSLFPPFILSSFLPFIFLSFFPPFFSLTLQPHMNHHISLSFLCHTSHAHGSNRLPSFLSQVATPYKEP